MRSPLSPAGCASARRSSANPFPAFTPQVSRFSTKTGESLSHKLTSATSHLGATYCFSEKGGKSSNSPAFQREAPEGVGASAQELESGGCCWSQAPESVSLRRSVGLSQGKPHVLVKTGLGEARGPLEEPRTRLSVCAPTNRVFPATERASPPGSRG